MINEDLKKDLLAHLKEKGVTIKDEGVAARDLKKAERLAKDYRRVWSKREYSNVIESILKEFEIDFKREEGQSPTKNYRSDQWQTKFTIGTTDVKLHTDHPKYMEVCVTAEDYKLDGCWRIDTSLSLAEFRKAAMSWLRKKKIKKGRGASRGSTIVSVGYDDHVSDFKLPNDDLKKIFSMPQADHVDFLTDGKYVGSDADDSDYEPDALSPDPLGLFYDVTDDKWWERGGKEAWAKFLGVDLS